LRPFGNFEGLKSLPELIFEAKIGPFWTETWRKINPNKLYLKNPKKTVFKKPTHNKTRVFYNKTLSFISCFFFTIAIPD
jgi:hypothetical protein